MAEDGGPAVRYELSGRVARLTLNRPKQRNALSGEVTGGLLAALERAGADEAVNVVVLTGAGEKSFCAGGDLTDLARMGAAGRAHPGQAAPPGRGGERGPIRLFSAFRDLGKPIIARLAGHALGGGLGIAVSCDLAIAADDVKLGTPEINVGLWPMMIMAILNRHIGPKQAFRLYYTGQLISAHEAVEMGLLTGAVPRAALDQRVDELADLIAAKSPTAVRLGRAAFFAVESLQVAELHEQLSYLQAQLAVLAASDDAREGIAAFLEKRPPRLRGS